MRPQISFGRANPIALGRSPPILLLKGNQPEDLAGLLLAHLERSNDYLSNSQQVAPSSDAIEQ